VKERFGRSVKPDLKVGICGESSVGYDGMPITADNIFRQVRDLQASRRLVEIKREYRSALNAPLAIFGELDTPEGVKANVRAMVQRRVGVRPAILRRAIL